jgi:hypothetical protein
MPPDTTRAGPPPPGKPARHVVQHPTKATEPSTPANVAHAGDQGCDCNTYCAGCQLWPFRAALSGVWRALEALDHAA